MSATYAPMKYVKIWAVLLVLLAVSIVGPMFEQPTLTLITAFGIAIVKASLVATYFMHLNVEKTLRPLHAVLDVVDARTVLCRDRAGYHETCRPALGKPGGP